MLRVLEISAWKTFKGNGMDFGDYCTIEMKRHVGPNEFYLHKVINSLSSNTWVDVPVQEPAIETIHHEMADVISCVCCGVLEKEILKYRVSDVELQNINNKSTCPHLDNTGGCNKTIGHKKCSCAVNGKF